MRKKVEIDQEAVGQRMREEREKLGISRGELAELVGLSDYYIGQLERGERQMSLPVLVNISNCLHVSLDYLIFGKSYNEAGFINDSGKIYETNNKDNELNDLLNKCSFNELHLFKKLIKTILPYIN
ncbi:helix-turn-helix domain-containing protein [Candidatus Contubernalis alkaliaceticus]|uniref:helix-turn-helix domain-containing protein n=1 Tax=Candidatus Contubernalis alkaliaceticus TaxID=338645 RepID=UPI001F4C4414|nr:helix-turn-helix transcriptional regulator [Candidatus Contubernalis alkalaceticus]UNC93160.1 helix-turn-helix transcriptional regulator [Candidatus Contubernalis alkalaceticus]